MGIEFDDDRVDVGGVDDRRGGGGIGLGRGGAAIGGGAGVVGLVIYLLVAVLGGGSPEGGGLPQLGAGSANSTGQQESREELSDRCNAEGALEKYTDCRLIKVYDIADNTWEDEFGKRGLEYRPASLVFFADAVSTGCGQASAQVGPFYCPAGEEIYLDLDFLDQLQREYGAPGEFAQAYIVAHEYGHHLQTVLGTEQQVRQAQKSNPDAENEYSVAMELQADCYAGVWSTLADQQSSGIDLTRENIAEAQKAAEAVGDDRIQKKATGSVDQDSWTHGSAAQRKQWFTTGYSSGDIDQCDTFGAMGL
ncbi:membrane protein [Kineosporia sp. NBRC 101677]|uniref:KPN_02809 family neutral zinc metallopeptidase n=1 Tax=Kineosporia sp. NBRC 101677 TaxID=3032197 RepID=UPI0024A27189|nr:neutral zinc metallopeptidase [Kineosporia sp. NBRC 101677]GLY18440.1 membrane protein [Kineosporia sp. NBRC 101677]